MIRVHWRLELNVDAERVRARTWIRHVIQTTRGDIAAAARVAVRGVDLRIQTRVATEEQEVVARDIHARRLATHDPSGESEGVAERDVLQPRERSVLDPARGELGRLADAVRVTERRGEEITALLGVALRLIDESRVVERLATELTAPQPARVEMTPREVVVQAEREIGIRGA